MENLQIKIISCEEKLENAELDALSGAAGVQHQIKYLQTLSKNLDNNFKGYFVVAQGLDEIIGWTFIFIDSRFSFDGVLSGAMEKIYKVFPAKFKTAFISSPVAEYNVIHIKDKHKSRESDIVDIMIKNVLKFLKDESVKLVIIKDHIVPYASEYLHKKFIHLHFMPGTFVDLEDMHSYGDNCSCFDDYLMGLRKKWRANIRNKINRRKNDLTIEVTPAASLSVEQRKRCHELYFQTREKQRLKHECLSPNYFCACGKELGEHCKMLIAKKGEHIIGFAQLLENEDNIINVRMGMDYRYSREYNLYYHLLYENISYCILMKKKRLYTSQTCYRPKLEVGAKLLPLHTYLYFNNPILQQVFGRIIASNCRRYSELIAAKNPTEVLAKYNLSAY